MRREPHAWGRLELRAVAGPGVALASSPMWTTRGWCGVDLTPGETGGAGVTGIGSAVGSGVVAGGAEGAGVVALGAVATGGVPVGGVAGVVSPDVAALGSWVVSVVTSVTCSPLGGSAGFAGGVVG